MDDQYSAFATIAFLDSNIVLECLPLDQLPWTSVDPVGPILILLTPTLLKEVDSKKKDGRLGPRAREFNRMVAPIATTGKPVTLITEPVRVDMGIARCGRIDWTRYDDLDPQQGDASIVAEVLNVAGICNDRRVLVSQDINPLIMAQGHGVKVLHVPDTWLLKPEPSAHEKEAMRLKQQLAEYKKTEPTLNVGFITQPESVEVHQIEELTAAERNDLTRSILARHPKPKQERPPQFSALYESQYDHTLDDRYAAYVTKKIPTFVANYRKGLELLLCQVPFTMSVKNSGIVRADRLKIDVHMVGGWMNSKAVFFRHWGPVPPEIKNPLFTPMPFHRQVPFQPPAVDRHEMDVNMPGRSTDFSVQCEDFRQGQEWTLSGVVWLDPYYEDDPLVVVSITAVNLHGTTVEKFMLKKAVRQSRVFDLVDKETVALVGVPYIQPIIDEAIKIKNFNAIEFDK